MWTLNKYIRMHARAHTHTDAIWMHTTNLFRSLILEGSPPNRTFGVTMKSVNFPLPFIFRWLHACHFPFIDWWKLKTTIPVSITRNTRYASTYRTPAPNSTMASRWQLGVEHTWRSWFNQWWYSLLTHIYMAFDLDMFTEITWIYFMDIWLHPLLHVGYNFSSMPRAPVTNMV